MGRREDLERLRLELWLAFDEAPAAVKAQVAGQLRAVIKDLAELPDVKEVNPLNDVAAARARRKARAKVS